MSALDVGEANIPSHLHSVVIRTDDPEAALSLAGKWADAEVRIIGADDYPGWRQAIGPPTYTYADAGVGAISFLVHPLTIDVLRGEA